MERESRLSLDLPMDDAVAGQMPTSQAAHAHAGVNTEEPCARQSIPQRWPHCRKATFETPLAHRDRHIASLRRRAMSVEWRSQSSTSTSGRRDHGATGGRRVTGTDRQCLDLAPDAGRYPAVVLDGLSPRLTDAVPSLLADADSAPAKKLSGTEGDFGIGRRQDCSPRFGCPPMARSRQGHSCQGRSRQS